MVGMDLAAQPLGSLRWNLAPVMRPYSTFCLGVRARAWQVNTQAVGDLGVGQSHAPAQVNAAFPQPGAAGAADSRLAGEGLSDAGDANGVQYRLSGRNRQRRLPQGQSKTVCTGSWTWCLTMTNAEAAGTIARRIWPGYENWSSTSPGWNPGKVP